MRVLVTGGSGFLGRRVIELLLGQGHDVRAYLRRPVPGLARLGASVVLGTLEDAGSLRAAMAGADAVIHCAGKTGVWGPLEGYLRANTMATSNVLKAAIESGIGYFVHTSTPSVAHLGESLEGVDEGAPYMDDRRQGYPYSKMLSEREVLAANSPSFRTLALRPHLVWGPRDPHFLPRLFDMEGKGKLRFFSGGPYLVSHTYIDNAAHAHLLALERMEAGAPVGGLAYFIAEERPMDIGDLVNSLLGCGGRGPVESEVPKSLGRAYGAACELAWRLLRLPGEPPMTSFTASQLSTSHYFDLTRARTLLGYKPLVALDDAFAALAAWLKENPLD
jgi:nucleoside-diphosphate-sugar epimerase